jgi:hypothetical protein
MQDEFDADGYEPEHDQYLDNDDESSELHVEDDEFDDQSEQGREPDDPDAEEVEDAEELDDLDDELDIWDDL